MGKKSKSSTGSGVSAPSLSMGSQSGFYQASQGAGLIGGLINSITSPFLNNRSQRKADYYTRRQMAIQNDYNLGIMAYQYDLNKRALDYANEYNLPVNQVRRLMEAGINPASLSGMGEGGAMASSSALGGSMGSSGVQHFADPGFSALSGAASQAMVSQSQANLNNSQAAYYRRQATDLADVSVSNLRQGIALSKSQESLNRAQQVQTNLAISFYNEQADAMLLLTRAQVDEVVQRTAKLQAETFRDIYALNHTDPAQAQSLISQVRLNLASTQEAYARASDASSHVEVNNEMAKLINNQALDMFEKYLAGKDENFGYKKMNAIQYAYLNQMMKKDASLAKYFNKQGQLIDNQLEAFWMRFYMDMAKDGMEVASQVAGLIMTRGLSGAIPKPSPQSSPSRGSFPAGYPNPLPSDSPWMF